MNILKAIFIRNWKTTLAGVITGGAIGYTGYTTANPELIMAGIAAAAGGIMGSDAKPKRKKKVKP